MRLLRVWVTALFYFIKGDFRYWYLLKMRKRLSWNREKIMSVQTNNLRKIIRYAYDNSEYYRKIFDEKKINPNNITTANDLKKIPVLTKEKMKKYADKIKTKDKYGKTLFKVTSGGSTGNKAELFKSKYFEEISRAIYLSHIQISGWKLGEKSMWIWGAPYEHENVKKSLVARFGFWLNNRILINAYDYSTDDFPLWIKKIREEKPKILFGYASIILEFAKYILDNNIEIRNIERVISTTEKLQERHIIERAFNCKVFDQYGCREIPMISTECSNGHMHVADDFVIVESIHGEAFLTALYSYGFPLIRYKVGDVLKLDNEIKEDYAFSTMQLDIGRITDNLINKQNRKISSSAFSTYLSTYSLEIKEYQVIQLDYDKFKILIVPDRSFGKKQKDIFYKVFNEYFGKVDIEFLLVEKIPREKSGKKLLVKNLLLK